ncbi:MAG: hypothetical protein ABFC77_14440 [Thermoguttaceae bacterium]
MGEGKYYLTAVAVAAINTHEQHHTDTSWAIYATSIGLAENEVTNYRKGSPFVFGATKEECINELAKRIDWNKRIAEFQQRDSDANKPGGTIDIADSGKWVNYGTKNWQSGNINYRATNCYGVPGASCP